MEVKSEACLWIKWLMIYGLDGQTIAPVYIDTAKFKAILCVFII